MGTPLGPKYIPYTYMDPLGMECKDTLCRRVFQQPDARASLGVFCSSATWVVVKMMVPFWIPIVIRHLIFRGPKRDHNFDNHPLGAGVITACWPSTGFLRLTISSVLFGIGHFYPSKGHSPIAASTL